MNWQTIFNPFSKFSERKLLGISTLSLLLLLLSCYFTNTRMDSLLHFSPSKNMYILSISIFVISSLLFAVLLLFALGKIFNRRTRFIDIVNTVLISQAPVFLTIISAKLIDLDKIAKQLGNPEAELGNLKIDITDLMMISAFGILNILILIYSITLLFNGFKTATNIKKWQQITVFAVILFFGILICQFILPLLIKV